MTIDFDPSRLYISPVTAGGNVETVVGLGRVSNDPGAWPSTTSGGHEQVGRSRSPGTPTSVGSRQCRTCAERKYKDVSSDSSVSFQVPTRLSPEQAASAVAAHEQEHVSNNAARAASEGMQATSTVTIHTDICPECGRVYVAGGTTRTTYTRKVAAALDEDSRGLLLDATA
jgi:hypothetical protein